MKKRGIALGAAAAAVGLLATGCAVADPETDSQPASVAPSSAPTSAPAASPTEAATPEAIVVKDGVGMDYQAAQDAWRDQGLTVLPAQDATGAGRSPVLDDNWIVVSQSPAAGKEVAGSEASITATVTKKSDGSPSTKTPAKPKKVSRITVKNGVGLSYQKAQDVWRAQGLTVGIAEDATGRDRLAFLDSNWVVVGQDLAPGQQVKDGAIITASIQKYSD